MQALLDAADRGVRVRFLVDDVFTTVPDKGLALLDVHQNIEIRIFNLVKRPGPKPLGLLVEFPRTNRRMHNT
jgi:cardiolipin synthase C